MKAFNIQLSQPAVKKRNLQAEERVGLLRKDGKPTPAPNMRKKKNGGGLENIPWAFSRLMRYLTLTAVSAMVTFFILHKESKAVKWNEYHHLLEPEVGREERCYNEQRGGREERCTCPDPAAPMPKPESTWKSHHSMMLEQAKNAPRDLDVVFLGDDFIDQWTGTGRSPEVKAAFESRFSRQKGGSLEGLALGSMGDVGPNVLWHLQNGLVDGLNPKVFVLVVGNTDLYGTKCTDRFVVANILNVIRLLYDLKPEAQRMVHGILPRLDAKGATFLGKSWKRGQAINTQVRRFIRRAARLRYLQGGMKFLKDSSVKGRKMVDPTMMKDGALPTMGGLEVWCDYVLGKVKETIMRSEKATEDVEEES